MKDRNKYLETDGLFWESDSHEWFNNKSTTIYAQNLNALGISLPNVVSFVVRNKETGDYNYVLMDNKTNELIYESQSIEQLGVHIDMLKAIKCYEKDK